MAKCKTDGAHYSINIDNGTPAIGILVTVPYRMRLTVPEESLLRKRLHDAIEAALAQTFKFGEGQTFGTRTSRTDTYMINR